MTKIWLASAGLFVVALSGCVSSNSQNFASGIAPQERTASVAPRQEAPLAIASSSSMAAVGPDGRASTYDEDAIAAMLDGNPNAQKNVRPGEKLAYVYETDPRSAENAGAGQRNSLYGGGQANSLYSGQTMTPADDPMRPRPERRYASLTTPVVEAGQQTGYMQAASTNPEQYLSPADAAAEARIPALYASIKHGQCKGEWGPKPKLVNVKRMATGDPYYMEMRLRHTPLLPVGHVYIAYGRLGPDGNPIDEKLVMLAPIGGYGGAAFAAAVPMPGVLEPYGDDCVVRPHAAYRISLSPSRYEQLLLEIQRQKEKKPAYSLFAYNCNHFMSDVAKSVGILPPENIYEPSLQYFYSMMERNEGYKVPRTAKEVAVAEAKQLRQQQHNALLASAAQ